MPQGCNGMLNLDAKTEREFGAKRVKEVLAREPEARSVVVARGKRDKKPSWTMDGLVAKPKDCHGGAAIITRKVADYETGTIAVPWKRPRLDS